MWAERMCSTHVLLPPHVPGCASPIIHDGTARTLNSVPAVSTWTKQVLWGAERLVAVVTKVSPQPAMFTVSAVSCAGMVGQAERLLPGSRLTVLGVAVLCYHREAPWHHPTPCCCVHMLAWRHHTPKHSPPPCFLRRVPCLGTQVRAGVGGAPPDCDVRFEDGSTGESCASPTDTAPARYPLNFHPCFRLPSPL